MKANNLGKVLAKKGREKKEGSLKMGYLALVIFIVSIILIIISPKGFLNPDGYGPWLGVILLLCIWKLYYFKHNWNAVYKKGNLSFEEEKYAYLYKKYQHLAIPPKHHPGANCEIIITCPNNSKGKWVVVNDWSLGPDENAGEIELCSISDSELTGKINIK